MDRKNILLVDDTKAHRSLFIRALKKAEIDVSVTEVSSLQQGLALCSTEKTAEFDLAVVDLNLGDGLGTELISTIRKLEQHNETPLVVFSTSPMESDREKSLEAGANAYEIKEGDPLAFREQVARIVNYWIK